MKVLFVTRGFPSVDDPMAGNYEAVQAKALARKGIDVTVLNYQWKSLSHLFRLKKPKCFEEDGVKVIQVEMIMPVVPYVLNSFEINRWVKKRALARLYRRYLRHNSKFDVVHAHSAFMAYVSSVLKEKFKVPFVITEHWSKLNYEVIGEEEVKLCEGYAHADAIITVSSQLADSLKRKFGADSVVIHNMVADRFFDGELKQRVSDKIKFVSVGALIPRKGYDILIKAFANAKKNSNCTLSIVGAGPEEAALRELICEHQLQDKVFLLGGKSPDEIGEIIEDSDCFALTSRRETFGIVYIEAMAKGKPVIATVCGGPESFVNASNGVLIPQEDIAATSDAIDYMVDHIKEFDAQKIRQDCYDSFSEDVIADKIIEVYKKVTSNHSQS